MQFSINKNKKELLLRAVYRESLANERQLIEKHANLIKLNLVFTGRPSRKQKLFCFTMRKIHIAV